MGLILDFAKKMIKFRADLVAYIKSVSYKPTDPTLREIFPQWLGGSGKEKLSNAYTQLGMIYACVTKKARSLARVPWELFKLNGDVALTDGSIVDLFDNPSPVMSKYDLIESFVICLDIGGEFFFWPDDHTDRLGVPLNLWVFPSRMVEERTAKQSGEWTGWIVKDGNDEWPFDRDELYQCKYYNPEKKLRGLKPLSPLAMVNKIRFNALLYSEKFFENDATPPVVYENEKPMNQRQVDEFHDYMDRRRGVAESHRELLLWGGVKAHAVAHSNKDIQLIETLGLTDDDICSVFDTPKEIILGKSANYATLKEMKRGWWKETIIPLGVRIAFSINKWLKTIGYEIRPNFRKVDILNEEFLEKTEAAEKLYKMGVPFADLNERLDMGFEHRPWYEEPYQPGFGSVPVEEPPPPEKSMVPRKAIEGDITDSEEIAKTVRAARWKKLEDEIAPTTARCAASVRKYFREAQKKMMSKIKKTLPGLIELKDDRYPNIDELLEDLNDEKLQKYLQGHFEKAIAIGIDSVNMENVTFSMIDDKAAFFVKQRLTKIVDINDTVRNQLSDMLKDSIEQGLTEAETAKLIEEGVSHIMTKGIHRARTIARTEIHGAYSDGRYEAMDETEPLGKQWLDSRDDAVRDDPPHNLDGEVQKWNNPFSNGLQRPHDPNGSAGNIINCRCNMVAIYDPDEFAALGGIG